MSTTLITGANRGIGLGLAARCAARPDATVIAVARDVGGADELRALVERSAGRVRTIEADLGDASSIERLVRDVGDTTIDLLVNNAGVSGSDFGAISPHELSAVFAVNTFAPLLLTQALRDRLVRGSKVVNITSVLGSIADAEGEASYFTYGMSKAALNMFSVKLAAALHPRGVAVLALHPGWVRTRMGGAGASISVDESADGMMRVIAALTIATTGSYLAYDGRKIPW